MPGNVAARSASSKSVASRQGSQRAPRAVNRGPYFAPVWTVLYVLMAVAAWLVWRRAGFRGAGVALSLFLAQLALNALWSYLFFGVHRAAGVESHAAGPPVAGRRRQRFELIAEGLFNGRSRGRRGRRG